MLDLAFHTWPLAIPITILAVVGQVGLRRAGPRGLWAIAAFMLIATVVTAGAFAPHDNQPVMARLGGAVMVFVPALLATGLVLDLLSRKRWHVAVVTGTEIAAGYVCAFAALGPAMIVQGMLGGDAL